MAESSFEIHSGLVNSLRSARRVAALTGAGISAESGVPTFREAQTGLWSRYSPQELATPAAFRKDPRLVWEWYAWRGELTARAQPNPGHLALVEMERRIPQFTLITQNVDGLHRRAGSHNILELHGNLQRIKCMDEGCLVERWIDDGQVPPRCPNCEGLLRPDVVWFGENLPVEALQAAWDAAEAADVFFSIGTSTLVEPAASLPFVAHQHGAVVVEINLHETPLTRLATYSLKGPSGQVLPALIRATWGSPTN
jgi:NAD-dependent deacetylase